MPEKESTTPSATRAMRWNEQSTAPKVFARFVGSKTKELMWCAHVRLMCPINSWRIKFAIVFTGNTLKHTHTHTFGSDEQTHIWFICVLEKRIQCGANWSTTSTQFNGLFLRLQSIQPENYTIREMQLLNDKSSWIGWKRILRKCRGWLTSQDIGWDQTFVHFDCVFVVVVAILWFGCALSIAHANDHQ